MAELTQEQLVSLRNFRLAYDMVWKDMLSTMWMVGSIQLDDYPGLYKLRNTHGPSWLDQYELKEDD